MRNEKTPFVQAIAKVTGRTTNHCYQWFHRHMKNPANRMDALEYFAKFAHPILWLEIKHLYKK